MNPVWQRGNETPDVDRRSALRSLFMIPAGFAAGGLLGRRWRSEGLEPAPAPPAFRGYVAGFRFHDGPAMIDGMREGDPVTLVREPENAHDPHAVRIDYRGRKIGYVPGTVSEHVTWALGDRAAAPGVISGVTCDAVPWRAVRVRAG